VALDSEGVSQLSYITLQDLLDELGERRLVQLTDKDKTGEVDITVANKAIAYACGLFDSYARTRYTLPVPTTEMVKNVCFDLALYKLERALAKTQETIDNLNKSLYNPALKLLTDIQSGKAALDVPAAEETATNPASPDKILKGVEREQFTHSKLRDY
jgi:phage gp36-like protein